MKIRLNHNCGMKGLEGMPGTVIDVEPKYLDAANEIVRRGGAVIVGEAVETATRAASENAAKRTTPPPARGGK